MMKKSTGLFIILGAMVSMTQISCDSVNDGKQKEEIHNPASQTIPEEAKGLIGRWDITVDKNGKQTTSWLEVKLSGFNVLVGAFVSDDGSRRPVSHIKLNQGKFSFRIPPQWEGGHGVITIQGALVGEELKGT